LSKFEPRTWLARAQRASGWLLFSCALAILGYRLLNPDLFPFMVDEPQLLAAARAQLETGHWATASPLLGNQGLHYGAGAVWVYGVIHWLAGPSPEVHIYSMAGLVILTTIALAVAIGRLYGDRVLIPATVLALIASSPYQFLWSRMAWDQLVEVCAGLSVALLCMEADLTLRRVIAVGILLGLGVSTHLMMGLTAVLLLGFAVLRSPPGRRIAHGAAAAGSALVVGIPYLHYLASDSTPAQKMVGMPWRAAVSFLEGPIRVATIAEISRYLDVDWTPFATASPRWAEAIERASKVMPWLVGLVALVLILTMLRSNSALRRHVAALTLAIWVSHALLYAYRRVNDYPNYYWPTWWIPIVAVAAGLHLLRHRLRPLWPIALGLVWTVALVQSLFLVRWIGFVREHGGARGICFGTVISEERHLVRAACEGGATKVFLQTADFVFPNPLRYLATIEPACAGKQVVVGPDRGSFDPKAPVRRVVYRPPDTARLGLE
jgi:hypothetical protein